MSPRACLGCLVLFDPSEYSRDILCKLTNILMIILNFLIGTEQHQKDIGGVDELRELRILPQVDLQIPVVELTCHK